MDGYHDNGKRKIVSFTGKTKGEVLDKIRDFWESDRKVESTSKITFGGWADIWYADYRTQVQPSHSDQEKLTGFHKKPVNFSFYKGEIRTVKCGADERRWRRLDGGTH